MKKFISKQSLAVVALLCSSTGFAATVTVTPSNAAPTVGQTFSLDVFGADFPNTVGPTLKLFFSSSVELVTPVLTGGIVIPAGSPFTGGVAIAPPADPFTSGRIFSVLAPTVGTLPTGSFGGFAAFRINFRAIAPGAANIVISDDGGDFVWSDEFSLPIVTTYTQANNVTVSEIPAPAAVWLLGTGVIALAGRRLRRQKAA